MGWLIGPTIASIFGAVISVRIIEHFTSGVTGTAANIVHHGAFVGISSLFTTMFGMRKTSSTARSLRRFTKKEQ